MSKGRGKPRVRPLTAGDRDRWLIRPFKTVEVIRVKRGVIVWSTVIYLN